MTDLETYDALAVKLNEQYGGVLVQDEVRHLATKLLEIDMSARLQGRIEGLEEAAGLAEVTVQNRDSDDAREVMFDIRARIKELTGEVSEA